MKEVSQQNRELLRQALEEAQAELSKKFELIREIRAIESLPHIRTRTFDDTEVSYWSSDSHLCLCAAVALIPFVRLQATSCRGRCPWLS